MYTQEERMKYIGGSDIASVMGMSEWKTPLQLWAEKTGEIEMKDLSDNQYIEWGTRLEDVIAKKYSEKNNVKLMAYKKRFYHSKYSFMSCELDRIVVGTDKLVEIKTCNAYAYKKWEGDEIPKEYLLQVQWDMGIAKRNVCDLAVLIGGNNYKEKNDIMFDQELFDIMVERAKQFWDMVKKKIPPMALGQDKETLLDLYPSNASDEIKDANNDLNVAIARRFELIMHIDNMIKEKDEIDAKLKQIIADNTGIRTNKYTALWKEQGCSPKTNTEQMKKDGVYDKYITPNTTRVLRIKLNEEAKKNESNGKTKKRSSKKRNN